MKTHRPALLACAAGCLLVASALADDPALQQALPLAATETKTNEGPGAQPAAGAARSPDARKGGGAGGALADPLAGQLREVRPSLRLGSESEAMEARMREASRTRAEKEAALRTIRRLHFGHVKATPARQEGLAKLEAIAEPALYPLMIEVFRRDDVEAKRTLMDIFERAKSDEGDASLAWMAIFDGTPVVREEATRRVQARKQSWPVCGTPRGVQLVAFEGLGSRKSGVVARAGGFVDALSIVEALPWMIAGQVQTAPSGGTRERSGALAWIVVGSQTNYVSDLTPIVSEGAVAFDPEISTLTSGTYIRVLDATVVTYNLELHQALHRFGKRLTGKDTTHLGWDYGAWRRWHRDEFVPLWTAHVEAQRAKASGETIGAETMESAMTSPGDATEELREKPAPAICPEPGWPEPRRMRGG
jgi:hypothetical protein